MKMLVATSILGFSSLLGGNTANVTVEEDLRLNQGAKAVNILLHDGDMTYTVPPGKALLVEHLLWALESDSTHQVISIDPANRPASMGVPQLNFTASAPDSWSPGTPLRIVEGGRISIIKNTAVDWRDVVVCGRLANN